MGADVPAEGFTAEDGMVSIPESTSSASPAASTAPPPTPTSAPSTPPRRSPAKSRHKPLPVWQVVLLDDDEHTYDYVIEMLGNVFGHPTARSKRMAKEVDTTGRVVVFRSHRELVELKCEQIARYGADIRISSCKGSMFAFVEPAM